jgi:cytochrome P450/NADPH-cytochrome P450 reductase
VFEEYESTLWDTLSKVNCSHPTYLSMLTRAVQLQEYQTSKTKSLIPGSEVKIVDPGTERAATLRQADAALGRVVENRLLTKPGAPMKRHIGECVIHFLNEDV